MSFMMQLSSDIIELWNLKSTSFECKSLKQSDDTDNHRKINLRLAQSLK
jgi:hypothetical protein